MTEHKCNSNEAISIRTVKEEVRRRQAFSAVFHPDEDLTLLFSAEIPVKRILYPITYALDAQQVVALGRAISAVGECGCYISLTEISDKDVPSHLFIPVKAIGQYHSLHPYYRMFENAIYSTEGSWGIWLNMDEYGLIGGTPLFVDTFFNALGADPELQIRQFITDLVAFQRRHDLNLVWVRRLFANIYDETTADQIINGRFLK